MRLTDADATILDARANYGGVHDAVLMEYFLNSQPTIAISTNDPLTLEELREMDWESVWVVQTHDLLPPFCGIVDTEDESVANNKYCANFEDYDTEWLAYRHKPEEG